MKQGLDIVDTNPGRVFVIVEIGLELSGIAQSILTEHIVNALCYRIVIWSGAARIGGASFKFIVEHRFGMTVGETAIKVVIVAIVTVFKAFHNAIPANRKRAVIRASIVIVFIAVVAFLASVDDPVGALGCAAICATHVCVVGIAWTIVTFFKERTLSLRNIRSDDVVTAGSGCT